MSCSARAQQQTVIYHEYSFQQGRRRIARLRRDLCRQCVGRLMLGTEWQEPFINVFLMFTCFYLLEH